MQIGQIIKGTANEFFGLNKDMAEERIKICKRCPLYTVILGQEICNNKLYLNTETGDISLTEKDGYKRGCGCRLRAKTTLNDAECPLGKW